MLEFTSLACVWGNGGFFFSTSNIASFGLVICRCLGTRGYRPCVCILPRRRPRRALYVRRILCILGFPQTLEIEMRLRRLDEIKTSYIRSSIVDQASSSGSRRKPQLVVLSPRNRRYPEVNLPAENLGTRPCQLGLRPTSPLLNGVNGEP